MTHDFKIDKNRISNDPTKTYWSCDNCDSGVLIPNRGYTKHQVNAFMSDKAPCLPPINKPIDDVIDNRTTILNQKPRIIIPGKH